MPYGLEAHITIFVCLNTISLVLLLGALHVYASMCLNFDLCTIQLSEHSCGSSDIRQCRYSCINYSHTLQVVCAFFELGNQQECDRLHKQALIWLCSFMKHIASSICMLCMCTLSAGFLSVGCASQHDKYCIARNIGGN